MCTGVARALDLSPGHAHKYACCAVALLCDLLQPVLPRRHFLFMTRRSTAEPAQSGCTDSAGHHDSVPARHLISSAGLSSMIFRCIVHFDGLLASKCTITAAASVRSCSRMRHTPRLNVDRAARGVPAGKRWRRRGKRRRRCCTSPTTGARSMPLCCCCTPTAGSGPCQVRRSHNIRWTHQAMTDQLPFVAGRSCTSGGSRTLGTRNQSLHAIRHCSWWRYVSRSEAGCATLWSRLM